VLSRAQRALREPDTLPSARVRRETEQAHATSFPRFVLERSLGNRDAVMALPFAADAQARHAALAARSLEEQKRIESEDSQPFEEYRLAYLGQDLLSGPHLAD
jgi:glutamate--cysteine ligase